MDEFVVKFYEGDEGPTIKGNGFDGLRVGENRDEAEEFVAYINQLRSQLEAAERIAVSRSKMPPPGRTVIDMSDADYDRMRILLGRHFEWSDGTIMHVGGRK